MLEADRSLKVRPSRIREGWPGVHRLPRFWRRRRPASLGSPISKIKNGLGIWREISEVGPIVLRGIGTATSRCEATCGATAFFNDGARATARALGCPGLHAQLPAGLPEPYAPVFARRIACSRSIARLTLPWYRIDPPVRNNFEEVVMLNGPSMRRSVVPDPLLGSGGDCEPWVRRHGRVRHQREPLGSRTSRCRDSERAQRSSTVLQGSGIRRTLDTPRQGIEQEPVVDWRGLLAAKTATSPVMVTRIAVRMPDRAVCGTGSRRAARTSRATHCKDGGRTAPS